MENEQEQPEVPQITYLEQIDNLIDSVVFDVFKSTPEYASVKDAILLAAKTSPKEIDEFIKQATSQGVSEEAAMKCVVLFVKSKT